MSRHQAFPAVCVGTEISVCVPLCNSVRSSPRSDQAGNGVKNSQQPPRIPQASTASSLRPDDAIHACETRRGRWQSLTPPPGIARFVRKQLWCNRTAIWVPLKVKGIPSAPCVLRRFRAWSGTPWCERSLSNFCAANFQCAVTHCNALQPTELPRNVITLHP